MLALTVRVGFGLLAIAVLLLVVRLTRNARARGEPLAVLSRQHLTRGGAVALVRIADRGLVLGVTEQEISLLTETHLPQDHPPAPTAQAVAGALYEPDAPAEIPQRRQPGDPYDLLITWRDAVAALRERTVRRPADPGSAIVYRIRTVHRP